MLWTLLFILVSFFAIIGLMEFIMCVMETFAMHTTKSIRDIRIEVDMQGNEPRVEFLLGSLAVMAERIAFRNLTTKVRVNNCGIDQDTYEKILQYCKENSTVSLIEKEK